MKENEVRPIIRILAGIIGFISVFATISLSIYLSESIADGIGSFIGGTMFSLFCLFACFKGKVPKFIYEFIMRRPLDDD